MTGVHERPLRPGDAIAPDEALAAGITVVTVNNRLARALAAGHAARMLAAGRAAWESPRVLPFDAFVAQCWSELEAGAAAALPRLLGAGEARALWQQVLAEAEAGRLLSTAGAAAGAADARERLLRHAASVAPEDCGEQADARAFAAWHARYCERLAAGGWADAPAAVDLLAERIRGGARCAPDALLFAGFEGFSPQQEALRAALTAAGVALYEERRDARPGRFVRHVGESPDAEVEDAARWARAVLEAGPAAAGEPVGVVFADLAERLDAVEACFEEVFHPAGGVAPARAVGERAFNVSLGRPLARVPVVADALAVLALDGGTLDAEDAGRLLLSPTLGDHARERGARLALEARLRDEGVRAIRARHLARLAARSAPRLAQRLSDALDDTRDDARPARGRRPLGAHAARFAALLETLGWPSGRALDSAAFQAAEALRGQLEALTAMEPLLGPCSAAAALGLLRAGLERTVFQPRAAPAPVQVMGVLEAAGMRFRALWLAGFHDGAWPPAERASPFLPMALQRRHGMPGASPELALQRAQALTGRLLAAAPEGVVSHAALDADTPLAPSALIGALPDAAPARWPGALADAALAAAAPAPERVVDRHARPVGHGFRARGGSRVLTDQAACPFRAFARHRLQANGVERAPAPLDARSRGVLAHRVMQELFARIAGSRALAALDAPARDALAAEAASEAVRAVLRRHPGTLPRRLADAERDRLAALAAGWLALEAARPGFEIEALEQRRVVRVGGLRLDIQIDRVDRVDGRRLLLDYKTGRAGRAGWFGERPDEPQLPLYALALDAEGGAGAPVAAVAFARLKRGAEGFEGIGEDPGWAPGLSRLGAGRGGEREFDDMAALKSHWARVLGDLAEAFAAGDAAVDPKPNACRYCDLAALCRIDEVRGAGGSGADGDEA